MKKKLFATIMVAAIAGICVITSCSKEESKSKDVMRNKILSSNDLCDSISNEIAKHHNIYLEDFIAKNLDNLSALNQNLADFLYNDISLYISNNGVRYTDGATLNDVISKTNYNLLINECLETESPDLHEYFDDNECGHMFDLDIIDSKCEMIYNSLEDIVTVSETFEAFTVNYNNLADDILSDISNINDYLAVRIYSDVFYNSFSAWLNMFYADNGILKDMVENDSKEVGGAWKKLKKAVKKSLENTRQYVAADAEGAVRGAIGGAVAGASAGGVGAGPGAVAGGIGGGIGGSVGKFVGNVVNNY